jgi:hypothetical protein
LQKSLAQAGFTKTKISNSPAASDRTVIMAKAAEAQHQKYLDEIKVIVAEKYAPQTGAALADSADYDVLIVIGKK